MLSVIEGFAMHGVKNGVNDLVVKKNVRVGCILSAITILLINSPSMAQESGSTYLDEITVTVEKVEQKAKDVPAALTVITKEDIENRGLENIQELDDFTPNLVLTDQGSPRFTVNSIRGIGSTVRDDYFSSSIGIYLDGVPLTAAEYSRRLGDLEQVEVLRGPQGTLYGRNTAAGVINMISRAPTNELEAEISGTIGDNGLRGVSGFLSGPIVNDKLFSRLFFDYTTRDGFTDYLSFEDGIDNLESITGSGTIVFTPNTDTKVSLSGNIERVNQGAYAFLPFDDYKKRVLDITPPNREDRDSQAGTLNVEHQFEFAKLQMITGLRDYEVTSDQDLAFHPFFAGYNSQASEEGTQFSQEVRLSGNFDGDRYRWLIGGFYQWDEVDYDYSIPGFFYFATSNYERQELAGFGEVTAKVTDQLDLTAGVRVSKDKHELANNTPFTGEDDFTIVTPKFRVTYHVSNDGLIYASAIRGARAGGFNRLSNGDGYDTEYLWSYEAGFKTSLFNNSLSITGAVFYIDWTDQQIRTEISPGVVSIENAGESHSKGLELDVKWRPSERWEIAGFIGLTSGEYDEYVNRFGVDLAGNTLVNAPELNAGASVQYEIPLGFIDWKGHVRADYIFTGEHYFDAENRLKQSGYGLVNLSAGIERENFEVRAFVKNLFDKDYRAYGYQTFETSAPYDIAVPGADRTYGLTVTAKF